ncbi:Ubiquinone biosynthesis protein coq7 [Globisporangium polare]
MSASGAISSAPTSTLEPHAARDIITTHAYRSGLKAGAQVGSVVGMGVLAAHHYSPTFRKRLGVSGKWALVVSSFLGSFTIVSEKRMLAGTRNPQKYLDSLDPHFVEEKINERKALKWYERSANYVYDFPYRTLSLVGVPLVGGIYAFQRTNTALAASQQIMHTRIYGQGAVVVLLLSSMAFHDYMAKRGRFEPEE